MYYNFFFFSTLNTIFSRLKSGEILNASGEFSRNEVVAKNVPKHCEHRN